MHYGFPIYISVAEKQKKAQRIVDKLHKKGRAPRPIVPFKGKMSTTFWGKSWCDNLESYADYENRLGRGRSYARAGCVCHLEIKEGVVEALVSGSELYSLTVNITPLAKAHWRDVCTHCAGHIGSLLELLQGKLSRHVMEAVCHPHTGIFPSPKEISFDCSCPDWASMCKHVAAVMYGIGRRLDAEPELLFTLRGVDAAELVPAQLDFAAVTHDDALHTADLGGLFGIDLDMNAGAALPGATPAHTIAPPSTTKSTKKTTTKSTKPSTTPRAKDSRKAVPQSKTPKPPFNPKRPTGAAIYKLRKLAGLYQQEFADALGISLLTLQRWEQSEERGTNKSAGALTLRTTSKERLSAFQESLLLHMQMK